MLLSDDRSAAKRCAAGVVRGDVKNRSNRLIAALALLLTLPAHAAEPDISRAWCDLNGGEAEHITSDRTRVDCLQDPIAWEFDWAVKWYSGLGQALHYAEATGAQPGIVLLYRDDGDERYLERLLRALEHHGLDVRVRVRGVDGAYRRVR